MPLPILCSQSQESVKDIALSWNSTLQSTVLVKTAYRRWSPVKTGQIIQCMTQRCFTFMFISISNTAIQIIAIKCIII